MHEYVLCELLCPFSGSSVQESHGHIEERPEKGYKGTEGTGSSPLWGKPEKAGTV